MTKISKTVLQKQEICVEQVGLSYSLQSHRNYIQLEHNKHTNEARILVKSREIQDYNSLLTPLQTNNNRYKRSGEVYQEGGLTPNGRRKIMLATRIIESINHNNKSKPATSSMVTLTYGKHFPNDHLSKKHLDTFFKRLKRKSGEDLQYLWVAEKQKRGAIHYHILTQNYVCKNWLNNAWNEIVNKWLEGSGHEAQTLYPNVIKVDNASGYLVKYLQKEEQKIGGNGYGIDQKTREMMKPEKVVMVTTETSIERVNEIAQEITNSVTCKEATCFEWNTRDGLNQSWISDLNMFALNEFINYGMRQNGLISIEEYNAKNKH